MTTKETSRASCLRDRKLKESSTEVFIRLVLNFYHTFIESGLKGNSSSIGIVGKMLCLKEILISADL